MENHSNQCSQAGLACSDCPKVLGHFYIENQCYLIVCAIHSPSEAHSSQSTSAFKLFDQSEVVRFEITGWFCVIVQATQGADRMDNHHLNLLSDRELQIAQLVALGQSNKQIAQRLSISKWTVLTHLRRIFAKLNVDSRAAMVYQLFANGLETAGSEYSFDFIRSEAEPRQQVHSPPASHS